MNGSAKEVGRADVTRDAVLKEMLRDRMAAIAATKPSATVYAFPFSGDIRGPLGPYVPTDSQRVLEALGDAEGQTLLYDTMAMAIEFGEQLLAKDPKARVKIYTYTDGDNYTQRSTWSYKKEVDGFFGRTVKTFTEKVRYRGDDAADRFARDFIPRIESYAAEGRMSLESGCWLGPSSKAPRMISSNRKDDYKLELATDGSELKNPVATPTQKLKADLLLPIPSRCEKDLARMNATAALEIGGKRYAGRFSLKPGTNTARIVLPSGLPEKAFQGKLSVENMTDDWKDVSLSSPMPVTVGFAAPGALSFVSVEPRESELFVKVGTAVKFSAKADQGAAVTWQVNGQAAGTEAISHTFDKPGRYTVTATAGKSGYASAVTTIKVEAIDAAVRLAARPEKPVTGDAVVLSAQTVSKATGYAWKVDGQAVDGKSSSLKHVFDRSGRHEVRVMAFFGHGISGEASLPLDAAVKPFVAIDSPYDGEEFDFGAPVSAVAKVEGDFATIEWSVSGDGDDVKSSGVDQAARASRPVEFKSLKGGKYKLVATVKGPAGELKSAPVRFSVKREDVMVRIDSPVDGATAEVGKDLTLKASVKGGSVTGVRWIVSCKGKTVFSETKSVQGGASSCAFKPAVELGNGAVLTIRAEAEGDAAVSSEVTVETSFFAALKLASATVAGKEANGLQASFGEQVSLAAECEGGADASLVEWIAEIDGQESVIGKGLRVNAPKVAPRDAALVPVKYFARVRLPDGSYLTSDRIIVYFGCDDIMVDIVLPKGADGLPQRTFRPGERIHLQVVADGGKLKDVAWDFGDGQKATGDNVEHSFAKEQDQTVVVKGRCAKCGKAFSSSVTVNIGCPDLKLDVLLPKGEDGLTRKDFGLKESVNAEIDNPDATDVAWTFGDGATAKGFSASHVYGRYGSYELSATAKCRHCGKSYSATPQTVTVKVMSPVAKFEIKERGSYCTVGSKLHLESVSTGDVEDLVWSVDGAELTEFRGKAQAVVHLPKTPGEVVVSLQAIGPDGTTPSSAKRDVRVRYGVLAIIILLLLALLVIGVLAWLLLNNGPAGWRINIRVGLRPDTSSERSMKTFSAQFVRGYKDGIVGHFWSMRGKFALMPIQKLAAYKKSRSMVPKTFSRDCSPMAAIKIGLNNGRPYIKGSSFSSEYIGIDVIQGDRKFQMFPQSIEREGMPQKCLFVALDTNHAAYGYVVWFVVLTTAVIAACAWAMMRYAI